MNHQRCLIRAATAVFAATAIPWTISARGAVPAQAARPAGVTAGNSTSPAVAISSPRWWFAAAVEHATEIPLEADKAAAERGRRFSMLIYILETQVECGDAEGAVALAPRPAPLLLSYVARVQAGRGDIAGALATVDLIADAGDKQQALRVVGQGLIYAKQFADAQRVLKEVPTDEVTAGLYESLAKAQSEAGDLVGAMASIKALREAPPDESGLNVIRLAGAYVSVAAGQARAGNRQTYREDLATARQMTKGFRPPYERNILLQIARAQAYAGDYEDATATFNTLTPEDRRGFPDLVLEIRVLRGDVTPAVALAKVPDSSAVYEAVMKVQLKAKDHKAAVETLKIAKGQDFYFSDMPRLIVEGFLAAGDVDGAADFVAGQKDAAMRAELYRHIAVQRVEFGDRIGYQTFAGKSLASALEVVDQPEGSNSARPRKSQLLGELAESQEITKDFDGARKTVAAIADPKDRRPFELVLRARELAFGGKLEEARTWVATLADAEERAQACRWVALELASGKNAATQKSSQRH